MERDIDISIAKYRNLKESSFYPFEIKASDTELVKERKKSVRRDIQSYRKEIQNFPEPQVLVNRFKENVNRAIEKLLEFVQRSNTGAPLDRNQGLIIENFIFGKVAGVINDSLKNGEGVTFPDFYYQPGGNFVETELRELLLDFKKELKKPFLNYFELEICVDSFLERIKDLWEKETKKSVKS
jgi:hypothetical protein